MDKSLEIKNTMKRHFPEYTDYLLIQYGSSVESNNRLPQDYDFIVLMLGIPKMGKDICTIRELLVPMMYPQKKH